MATSQTGVPTLRWFPGEVVAKTTTARLLLPNSAVAAWRPFSRIVETVATNLRQPPSHAHEREEVLTYMFEGFADYQYGTGTPESLPPGSVRLLTATSKATHRISPSRGSTVRWISIVLDLPAGVEGEPRVQSGRPRASEMQPDGSVITELVGLNSGITSRSGLIAKEVSFAQQGTEFNRIGHGRRGFAYVLAGRGAIDSQPVEMGEGVLLDHVAGVALHGQQGLRLVIGSAPASQ